MRTLLLVGLFALLLSGCARGLSGTYSPEGPGAGYVKLVFNTDGTFMMDFAGSVSEGTYELEADTVTMTVHTIEGTDVSELPAARPVTGSLSPDRKSVEIQGLNLVLQD